jgi:hypothetical protein
VLGFFLEVLLTDFSFGSFRLSAGAPIPVAAEMAMAPRASCSKLFPPYAEKDSGRRRGKEDGEKLT